MAFLDYTGLQRFLGKLKGLFATFTNVATGESIANIQTAIYNHAVGLTDMTLSPIKFSTAHNVASPFDSTTYLGFVRKEGTGEGMRLVVNAYGISGANQDLLGCYKNSAWTWASTAKEIQKYKPLTVSLGTITNSGGSYTSTTTVSGVTSTMKAIQLECSDPEAFQDGISITTATDAITLQCDDVNGTSTVSVTLIETAGG